MKGGGNALVVRVLGEINKRKARVGTAANKGTSPMEGGTF